MTTTLTRDQYGALCATHRTTDSDSDSALLLSAQALVALAATTGKLPAAYDTLRRDRKGRYSGGARHHEVYDFTASTVLVCVRETEGSKYGVKTLSKDYFLVTRCGRGVRVTPAPKAIAAKAAKASGSALGTAIAVCQGKRSAPAPKCLTPRTGYKIVRRDGTDFVSVWDDSPWAIGVMRTEAATPDHEGGYYYYRTLDEAIAEAAQRQAFGDAREYHDLSIIEVEASGREYQHDSTPLATILGIGAPIKRCATRIRPLREVCAIVLP